jgi:hypothetical protein
VKREIVGISNRNHGVHSNRVFDPRDHICPIPPSSPDFLKQAKHETWSIENEQSHEISELTDWLHSETQFRQSGEFLNGAKHRNFSIDEQFKDISGSADRLHCEISNLDNPDIFLMS